MAVSVITVLPLVDDVVICALEPDITTEFDTAVFDDVPITVTVATPPLCTNGTDINVLKYEDCDDIVLNEGTAATVTVNVVATVAPELSVAITVTVAVPTDVIVGTDIVTTPPFVLITEYDTELSPVVPAAIL